MGIIERQVAVALRRLNTNVLLHWASLALAVSAGTWGVLLLVDRAFSIGLPLQWTLAGAAAIALAIVAVGVGLTRRRPMHAAIAIDSAAGLKERVSTAIALGRSGDPFAVASRADAEKVAAGVHVPTHVPIRAPHSLTLSATVVASAALLYAFMPSLDLFATRTAQAADSEKVTVRKEEKKAVETTVNDQINRVKKMVEDSPALKDLAGKIEPLDIPDDPGVKPDDIRREAVKKLDNVMDQLEARREMPELKSLEEVQKQLSQLKTRQGKDPASKLTESLARNDMQAAKQSLEEAKKDIEEAMKSSDPEKKEQLAQMQAKLDDLGKQLENLAKNDQMQKELENKAGLDKETAKKLAEQIAKMDPKELQKALQKALGEKGIDQKKIEEIAKKLSEQKQAQQQMKDLAEAMQKAAQACQNPSDKSGDGESGAQAMAQAMNEAMQQLSEMEMAEQMMNDLEAQLSELGDMREGMCQNPGDGQGQGKQDKIGNQGPQAGLGYGSRIGREASAHKYKPTKVKSKMQGGEIIGQTLIDGPQAKGELSAEVRTAVNSAVRDATDAIERDRVPQQYHEVLKKYFDHLAGLGGAPAPEAPGKTDSDTDK